MKALFLLPVAALALGGCAITTEGTLTDPLKEKPDSVCVIQNPAVAIANSAQIIEKALEKRGVDAVVCASKDDCKSQWHLTYVLYRRWDLVPYLAEGRMDLYKNGEVISSVDYSGGWGFNFAKFGHTAAKIDGMVGALISAEKGW